MTSPSNDTPFVTPGTSRTNTRPSTPNLSTPPTTAVVDTQLQDDSSKLRIFLGLLKKFIGVADIANVRFSLPAQLLEPIPNLEYWHYLDRPETFASIGRSDTELGRMLEVLRFWFTKDLKYVKGKPCKPYNSTLGEFFRCNWEISTPAPPITQPSQAPPQPPADPLSPTSQSTTPVRISYLTEQTSHHPPVSAYYYSCPQNGIYARGYDQISAKFTGTSVRVTPGAYNRGIFITLTERDNEEYQLVHPAASLGGLLRGSLYISVADTCTVTCPKTRLKCIMTYVEESWFGRAQNRVHGVIYRYDPENDKYSRVKDVPDKDIMAKIEGCWQEQITYTIPNSKAVKECPDLQPTSEKQLLIDLQPLMPVPKIVPPPESQLPNESRELWKEVTTAITEKRYNDATRIKQDLEQAQRDKAAKRQAQNIEYKPRFFTSVTEASGKPDLSDDGRQALDGMKNTSFRLEVKPEPGL